MQRVHLIGKIAEKFGSTFEVSCPDIVSIFRLLECQLPGFRSFLVEAAEEGAGFEIVRGNDIPVESEEELLLSLNDEDIFITYYPEGSKSGGAKILAAVAIAVIVVASAGTAAPAGAAAGTGGGIFGSTAAGVTTLNTLGTIATGLAINLAISGLTQLLAPGPEVDASGSQEEGYLFNGPINSVLRGSPVPVLYGELEVGGALISVTYKTEPFVDDQGLPIEQLTPEEQTAGYHINLYLIQLLRSIGSLYTEI